MKKGFWYTLIGILAAIGAFALALALLFKRKSKKLYSDLDFNNEEDSIYPEEPVYDVSESVENTENTEISE